MKTVQITVTRSHSILPCTDTCDRTHVHHLVMYGADWDFLTPILGDSDSIVVAWGIAHSEWLWDVAPEVYAWIVERAPIPRVRRAELLALHEALIAIGSRCGDEFSRAEYLLRLMLFSVDCGRQPDGSFVVDTGRHFDPLDERGRKLFAPAKQGLLAHFACSRYNARTKILTELYSRKDARAKADAARAERRQAAEDYRLRQFTMANAPIDTFRIRDPRAGKFVWTDSRHDGERRASKRIARRAERRYGRIELRTMTA